VRRSDLIRSFIAAELNEEARDSVWECEQALRRRIGGDVKWVERANLHITLRFLGEVESDLLEDSLELLEHACEDLPPFEARVEGLDAFPNRRRIRVLWCGLSKGAEELHELAEAINLALRPLFPVTKDERFHPHITIGRSRGDLLQPEGPRSIDWDLEGPRPVCFTVSEVSIMQSQLRPEGPEYTRLWAVPLGGRLVECGRRQHDKR